MTRSVELATILLTDLVGSTRLASSVGPERADQLRDEYFSLLRDAFRQSGGTEFKNSGDGLWAAFSSASAAVTCAVRIQQLLERDYPDDDLRPHVRIGLSAGESTVDDGDYFGMPSIVAARLCDKAKPDGILVSPAVRLLAGRCAGIQFASVGELELKGLPDPMEAFELEWEALESAPESELQPLSHIPLPERLTAPYRLGFVGRAGETSLLTQAYATASKGERRVVMVSGEAGMGKTRLVADFAANAFDEGSLVLYGRCEEGLAVPYRPWVEALTHLAEHAGDADLTAGNDAALAELVRLAPPLQHHVRGPSRPAVADQYAMFSAVATALATLARQRPVLLILDDLHWADRETLQLLHHVVEQLPVCSLMVIGTYRDSDVSNEHPLTETSAKLHRIVGVEWIHLKGLSDLEVASLLELVSGQGMDDEGSAFARSLWSETSGSPFFVVELVRHLAETGILAQDERGRWGAQVDLSEIEMPQSVRAVVGQRVNRLGEDTQRVLSAAAVIGREFDVAVLSATVERDEDHVIDLLEQAMEARLVDEAGVADRFTFTHALVQHALYHDLSRTRRARLHLHVAEALEASAPHDRGARAAEVANHLFAATRPADLTRAIDYAIKAGDYALGTAAPEEAVRWYQQALEAHEPEDAFRAEILGRLGEAERQAGRSGSRERLLETAALGLRVGARDAVVNAAINNYRGFHSVVGEVDEERVEVLERALELVGPDDSPARARLLATLAGELSYSNDQRRFDLGREARAIAHRLDDPAVVLDSLQRTGTAMNVPQLFEERRERSAEATRLAREQPDLVRRFFAVEGQADLEIASGDMAAARLLDIERQQIAAQLRQPSLRWTAHNGTAMLDQVEGKLAEAEERAQRAYQLGVETGQPDAMTYFGGLLVQIRLQQGRYGELLPLLEPFVTANPNLPVFAGALTICLVNVGQTDEAREILDRFAETGFEFPLDVLWLTANVLMSEGSCLLEDRSAAQVFYDRLTPFAGLVASSRGNCQGSVSYYLGTLAALLGRPDQARQHLVEALPRSRSLRSPFNIARTLLALAVLDRESDAAQAVEHARESLELAESHGMAHVAAQASSLLSDPQG